MLETTRPTARTAQGVLKMELTSENDLFFHYTHSLDEQGFRLVQEQQKLMVDFAEYAAVLIRMLNTCIKEPLQHLAVFVMQRGGRAHLDFIQNMEYKFVELLSTSFVASDEETVRPNIQPLPPTPAGVLRVFVPHRPDQRGA